MTAAAQAAVQPTVVAAVVPVATPTAVSSCSPIAVAGNAEPLTVSTTEKTPAPVVAGGDAMDETPIVSIQSAPVSAATPRAKGTKGTKGSRSTDASEESASSSKLRKV